MSAAVAVGPEESCVIRSALLGATPCVLKLLRLRGSYRKEHEPALSGNPQSGHAADMPEATHLTLSGPVNFLFDMFLQQGQLGK
jgi:hypothetical protein